MNLNWDGTLDVSCVSQVPVNVASEATCPVYHQRGTSVQS